MQYPYMYIPSKRQQCASVLRAIYNNLTIVVNTNECHVRYIASEDILYFGPITHLTLQVGWVMCIYIYIEARGTLPPTHLQGAHYNPHPRLWQYITSAVSETLSSVWLLMHYFNRLQINIYIHIYIYIYICV